MIITDKKHNAIGLVAGVAAAVSLLCQPLPAQSRWSLTKFGGIEWRVVRGDAHHDQIEMDGEKVGLLLNYGVAADGTLGLRYDVSFPMLRTVPNLTGDCLSYIFGEESTPRVFLNGKEVVRGGRVTRVGIRGLVTIDSNLDPQGLVTLERTIFPSTTQPVVIENDVVTNHSDREQTIEVEDAQSQVTTATARGVYGAYRIASHVDKPGLRTLKPQESASFARIVEASIVGQASTSIAPAREETARKSEVEGFLSKLELETPEPMLNTAFAFAKIRAAESVYRTKGGLMHSPGAGYYAAVWANDQAEYAGPFFPFLGASSPNEATINMYLMFAHYMNPEYKPIPSSVISEGTNSWSAAGDRGDMAMIAYGASRFALAYGDKATAEKLWPLIEWNLEYCHRKLTAERVVASDSDELENRFPPGKANLNTSSLYYDALRSAALLGQELGKPAAQLDKYTGEADSLALAIDRYFGATVQGFATYRYDGERPVLRAWIGTPLTMGLYARKAGTLDALFSPALWGVDGDVVESGKPGFWDRATEYALRGALEAGATEVAMTHLREMTQRRLLGEHAPYFVEQGPNAVGGGRYYQRQLSGESALYCRIYTEGLFGIRPTGLRSFTISPRIPQGWETMALKKVEAFGSEFDVVVTRTAKGVRVEVSEAGKPVASREMAEGDSFAVTLPGA